jgi:hypothetical protein
MGKSEPMKTFPTSTGIVFLLLYATRESAYLLPSEINFIIDESVDIPYIKTKFTKKPHQIYHQMRL